MFNTMTITKASGALIGSLLALLLLFWAGSGLFHVGPEGHGDEIAQAYTIPVETADAGGAAPAEEVDFATLLAEADVGRGERAFGKCRACHKLDGSDGVGPHLNGIVGRDMAAVGGFAYSDAMHAHVNDAPTWTPEALDEFLASPRTVVPGTKMTFAGMPRAGERADLIAYLETQP